MKRYSEKIVEAISLVEVKATKYVEPAAFRKEREHDIEWDVKNAVDFADRKFLEFLSDKFDDDMEKLKLPFRFKFLPPSLVPHLRDVITKDLVDKLTEKLLTATGEKAQQEAIKRKQMADPSPKEGPKWTGKETDWDKSDLERLEKALMGYDWYTEYSEDPSVRQRGDAQWKEIARLRDLVPLKLGIELWNKYAPLNLQVRGE